MSIQFLLFVYALLLYTSKFIIQNENISKFFIIWNAI